MAAARRFEAATGAVTELIISDDGSRDDTAEQLPREFPTLQVVRNETNRGFAAACNQGFAVCRYPVVALLNNDVEISPEYFVHMAAHFRDPKVFAVTAKVFEWDEKIFTNGGRFGRFRRGFWSVYFNYDAHGPRAADWIQEMRLLSAYAIGGFATYDRRKLEELGGFCELLSPFHWEDVDLSYRGWKRGWEVRYEPRSQARHRTSATIDAHYRKKHVDAVSLRNRLLFHWVNLHSPSYLAAHVGMLILLCLSRGLVLDHYFYRALWSALGKLPEARRLRARERSQSRCSDREIQRRLHRFYREAPIQVYYNQKEVIEKHPESK